MEIFDIFLKGTVSLLALMALCMFTVVSIVVLREIYLDWKQERRHRKHDRTV